MRRGVVLLRQLSPSGRALLRLAATATTALLLLTACTVGPDYHAPNPSVPDRFPESASTTPSAPDLSKWWQHFGDAEMQSLIQRGLESNLDLQQAASRIRQARAQLAIAGAAELPSLNASGAGLYMHTPAEDPSTTKIFSVGFDALWEIDLFGGTRRGIEAANAAAESAVWQYRDGQVSLTSEIAINYLSLCATRTRLHIVRDALQRQEEALQVLDAQRRSGFITDLDVNQQRAQVATTRSQIPVLEAEARATTHALGVLLAQDPEALTAELANADKLPGTPETLPTGLPSDLLRRRPDIRAAERMLATATAEVGVAVADLYPKFDLLGVASYRSNSLDGLFSSDNLSRLGVGVIRWPLFQGGRTRAGVKVSEEQRQQAYLAYQKSVLSAVRDADDAIARIDAQRARLQALLEAETAAAASLDIARSQSANGLVPYLNVLYAESTLLDLQNQIAQGQLSLAESMVSLFKALGGGWEA